MKPRATLRHHLGLSQLEMAMYLNINLSQLGMYEIGERDLPTTARVKLAAIEVFLNTMQNETLPETKPSIEELEMILKELNAQQKENAFKQIQLQFQQQKQREALQLKATQKRNLLAVLNHLSQEANSEANANSLQVLALSVPKPLAPKDILASFKLQLKQKALEDQSNYLATLITETQIALDVVRQNH